MGPQERRFDAVAAAWVRQAMALDALDDEGLGSLAGLVKVLRADLPGDLVALVDWLDSVRELAFAVYAGRKDVSVDELKAVLAGGGESDG